MPGDFLDMCRLDLYDTFEDNFEINKRLKKYFKASSYLVSDEYFSFKYFLKFDFVREISPK